MLAAAVLAAAGCGGGGEDPASERTSEQRATGAVAVIRAWADTLRAGDIAGAARRFGLPAVVENGAEPTRLTTREQLRAFNASLPCGARLIRTASAGRYTTAVFRLTERPGAGRCGQGTGHTARTTFVVRAGKIVEWRRVADRPTSAGPVV